MVSEKKINQLEQEYNAAISGIRLSVGFGSNPRKDIKKAKTALGKLRKMNHPYVSYFERRLEDTIALTKK
ncbi:MAG: hypothetical protein ABFS32_23470 [Bacteroidota bacterium]